MEILTGTEITTGRRKPSELVVEYEAKSANLMRALRTFEDAQAALREASSVGGEFGGRSLDTGRVGEREMTDHLLKSAWRYCYRLYNLSSVATAQDKRRIEQMFEQPPAFTVDNIREQFGDYVSDPWGSILRGLAEVFASLDPAFKSHEKMKIGVKGLPKRVILPNVAGYGSWGRDRLRDILNALAAYQRKPLVQYEELERAVKDGSALIDGFEYQPHGRADKVRTPPRGVWLKKFGNGNGHLFFAPETLLDINLALAEYYGDVLPDCPSDRPQRRASTDVAKDLQYYPTPQKVVDQIVSDIYPIDGLQVLEPSCGCGRFMDALTKRGAACFGFDVDYVRAEHCRAKGHPVVCGNFLDAVPEPSFDLVVMNPPFYGRHYEKHIRHALRFLKDGGKLISILPATARYDHGLLDDLSPRWNDLEVGAFAESGTNICTTVLRIFR